MPRPSTLILATVLAISACLSVLWLLLAPDPAAGLFSKAQQLDNAGQSAMALRHYQLLVSSQPNSFYAPRSLMRAADLLVARARSSNDAGDYRLALASYVALQRQFPGDALASEALLNAGQIAADNLKDYKAAGEIYQRLLTRAPGNSDTAAQATVRLGRLALLQGDAKTAQSRLQSVLQNYPRLPERAAEAQYHLGVVYETLTKQKDWASRAYEAVLARYPNSVWATDARERLGLLVFSDTRGQRPARRVMLSIEPLPDNGMNGGELWDTLRTLLAARGLDADETLLRGWSLVPFYAGLDTSNAGKTLPFTADPFENVLANVGLRFTVNSGGEAKTALRDLQDDLDSAGQPMVYLANGSNKRWALVIGYDSDRSEIMVQSRGARYETLAARAFVNQWKVASPVGGNFALLKFSIPGQKASARPSLTPTPPPTPGPDQVAPPLLQAPPSFSWELPRLQYKAAHVKTLNRAAALLGRPRQGTVLLGPEALEFLSQSLLRASRPGAASAPASPVEPSPAEVSPLPEEEPGQESPYQPTPISPGPSPTDSGHLKATTWLPFFGAPAREWAQRRREAAAYLERCGTVLGADKSKRASSALRGSAAALEEAIDTAPSKDELESSAAADMRARLEKMGQALKRAHEQEKLAASLMATG